MSTKRIKSIESNIYHRPTCKYIGFMKPGNRETLLWEDVKNRGYCACRHCNNMSFLCSSEKKTIEWNKNTRNMEFKYIKGILYLKTDMGCWKLVYSRGMEQIALYHRNSRQAPLDFKHPEIGRYHQQKDQLYFRKIALALNYIYDHDKYKAAVNRGDKRIVYKNKKYEKQAKKREQRAALRRVDRLFEMIEKDNQKCKSFSVS